jgi:hypothetical protein
MRFFIKFLEILTIVVGYGTISFLAFELLKSWLVSYLIWGLIGLVVICICALAASWACHMEDNE